MPNFTIETPNGKRLTIEAPDEATAIRGAQEWYAQQQKPAQPQAMPEAGVAGSMDGMLPPDTQGAAPAPQGVGIGNELRRIGRSMDDAARIGANALTFGLADRFAGAMPGGQGTDAERKQTAQSRERLGPVASTALDIAGGVATGAGLANAGLTAARLAPNAGIIGRTLLGGVDGAALGAANAAGYGEDVKKGAWDGFLGGGAGSLFGEALAGTIRGFGRMTRKAPPAAPSLDDLKVRQKAAYNTFDQINPIYDAKELAAAQARLQQQFAQMGADPALQPQAFAALRRLEADAATGNPITGKGLETIRRVAQNANVPGNASNNTLSRAVANEVEGIMANPNAAIGGNAPAAAAAVKEGRELTTRIKKQEILDKLVERAKLNADSAGSGGNVDNALRQQLKRILTSDKLGRAFTADEKAMVAEVVKGGPGENAMRLVGKLSPQGSGLMAALGITGTAVNPALAIPFAAGAGAKMIADRARSKSVDRLSELIRAGGNAQTAFGTPNMLERLGTDNREAIVRALLASGAIAVPSAVTNP